MKKLITGAIVILLLLTTFWAVYNLEIIYIMIYNSRSGEIAPHKAVRDNYVVIYKDGEVDNRHRLDEFINSFQEGRNDHLGIISYDKKKNLFTKYFALHPIKTQVMKVSQYNDYIEYGRVHGDYIVLEGYNQIKKFEDVDGIRYILKEPREKQYHSQYGEEVELLLIKK